MLVTQVQSLAWGDTLEKEMATQSTIVTWESHGQTTVHGVSRVEHSN